MGSIGDTTIYLCKTKQKDSLTYPVFYKRDTLVWQGRTFYNTQDFDSITQRMYTRGNEAPSTGFLLKKKAKIKVKNSFHYKVGMMPTFGWYIGKKKPGRYKQFGFSVKITANDSLSYDGIVYYYFQKQSFFKRFFKKRKIIRRFKRLPVLLGVDGPEVIFKNYQVQEGGNEKVLYYTFKLKDNIDN